MEGRLMLNVTVLSERFLACFDSQLINPPWANTHFFAIANPSPVPSFLFKVKKVSNIFGKFSFEI